MKLEEYVQNHIHFSGDMPKTKNHKDVILDILRKDPVQTAATIAKITGWKESSVAQWIKELAYDGIIRNIRMWVVLDEVEK